MKIVGDRSQHIEDMTKQLSNLKMETEELVNKCVSMERDARKEAGENSSQLRREANEFAEKLFSDTRDEVSEIKAAAVKEVEAKLEEAREELRNESEKLADELTMKVVGRRFAG
jgi:F0F1-type ATP synthase membrane subunit b/b'